MSVLRKIQRVGKRATKFQYTATYQSVVIECQRDKWHPNEICVSWSRRGRRLITKTRPWQLSPDSKMRGVVVWPEPETMEITVTLYKGPKDKSYETKEWEFSVIDVDPMGKRKVLAVTSINMVRYASSLPFDHDLHLRLKPVSCKIKKVILQVSISSIFLREGKATDDDMISIASQMSVSNLSTIGFLEDDDDDEMFWYGGRSVSPPTVPDSVLSTDKLIKWAQEVVEGYRGVKITNMTTSWRNGLGFLAIIHYHRPDLLEYEMLSPTSVKENNRLAFEIAHSLGISCSLTANMMLTSTVPDKLAVTSFVYQMNQYFTRAMQSAITRPENVSGSSQQSPTDNVGKTSPFDLSAFDRFTFDKLSPVASPLTRSNQILNVYSRHSRNSSLAEIPPEDLPVSPTRRWSAGAVTAKASGSPNAASEMLHSTPKEAPREDDTTHAAEVGVPNDTDKRTQQYSEPSLAEQSGPSVILGEAGSDRPGSTIDVVQRSGLSYQVQPEPVDTPAGVVNGYMAAEEEKEALVPSGVGDRALEFENLGESEDSMSEPPTGSSCSLDEENLRWSKEGGDESLTTKEVLLDSVENGTRHHPTGDSKPHRKLPAIPVDKSPEALDKAKKEERRKRAQDLLKQANIPKNIPTIFDTPSRPTTVKDARKAVYREKAIKMLNEAIGSPKTKMKSAAANPPTAGRTQDSPLTSEGWSSSLSTAKEGRKSKSEELETKREPSGGIMKHKTESRQRPRTAESQRKKNVDNTPEPIPANEEFEQHNVKTSVSKSGSKEGRAESGGVDDVRHLNQRRLSEGALAGNKPVEKVRSDLLSQQRPRSASAVTGGVPSKHKHRPRRALPVAKPVSDRPSLAVLRMAQERQQPKKPEVQPDVQPGVEPDGVEPDGVKPDGVTREVEPAEEQVQCGNGTEHDKADQRPVVSETVTSTAEVPTEDSSAVLELSVGTPPCSTTLQSPSAWSQHSEDLSQDLLVTQSDFVRIELLSLQQQLQALEERARNIEADIRNSMSMGNMEEEELLMQEWFGLLNRKNELIKRQIELNLLEKEEDLEKRQFFLNRELRPLMEIPEEQKSPAQKEREAHLLKELLELIDERDRLERRKMSTERETESERSGFAVAHQKANHIVHSGVHTGSSRSGSKDCVIS